MLETVTQVLGVVSLVAPFVAYFVLLRDGRRTRGQVVLGCALAASGPAIVYGILFSVEAGTWSVGVPWVVWAAGYGAFIGFAGLLARAVGRWLSERED